LELAYLSAVPYAPAESAESIGPILAMQQQANTMISHSSLEKWENLSIKTLIYQF